MNICTNCKYHTKPVSSVFCEHPSLGVDPVEGKPKATLAIHQRQPMIFEGAKCCGPNGDWYEEIDPPTGAPKGWWSFIRGRK